jgi:periplasmic copper chaperone A
LSVPAGGELALSADGPHLLLGGVKKRLSAYDSFKITLVFEKAGRMEIEVMVEEADTKEPHKH